MLDSKDITKKSSRGMALENPLASASRRGVNPLSSVRPHASAPSPTPVVSLRQGDTLWEVAQKKLGSGTRWGELRKADGSRFTSQEARHLSVGTRVYLPGVKPTQETTHPVRSLSQTSNVNPQFNRPEGIKPRLLTSSFASDNRNNQFSVKPVVFSRTSQTSSQFLGDQGKKRGEYFSATGGQTRNIPSGNSHNIRNQQSRTDTKNNTLNLASGIVTGTAVGLRTKEFFLAKRLGSDSRALALAERNIKAQLGENGIKAFQRISQINSPREAYTVIRRYINYASDIPGSQQLLKDLGSKSISTVKGAVGEIRQIPTSKLRRSRIELVADKFKGRPAADRVYKKSFLGIKRTIVDVKNYDFTKPSYQKPWVIAQKNKELNAQIARRRIQYPSAKIKYEFVGTGRVPREIVHNLRNNGVKVKVPIRTKALQATQAVRESRVFSGTFRVAKAAKESRVTNTLIRGARSAKESQVTNTLIRGARVAKESRITNTVVRGARVVGETKAASLALRGVSRVAAPLAVGLDAWELKNAYQKDGFGKEFRKTAGSVAGAWGGAAAGAAIGSAIFPGVGTVIGGAIGGIAGSAWGDDIEQGAETAGKAIAQGAKNVWNKLFG